MGRATILNPDAAPRELEPSELARVILTEARGLSGPEEPGRLDRLAAQLHDVHPERLPDPETRVAFWINLYNALMPHCLRLRPVRGSLLRHLRMFDRLGYRVGAFEFTLNLIEHGILRGNRRPPFKLRRPLRRSDPRLAAVTSLDSRIHFALNCGASSCPPIRAYHADRLEAELERGTRSYLEAETAIEPEHRRVGLPGLMRLYRADFGGRDQQLDFVRRRLPPLRDYLESENGEVKVAYTPFDWTVRAPTRV